MRMIGATISFWLMFLNVFGAYSQYVVIHSLDSSTPKTGDVIVFIVSLMFASTFLAWGIEGVLKSIKEEETK